MSVVRKLNETLKSTLHLNIITKLQLLERETLKAEERERRRMVVRTNQKQKKNFVIVKQS